MKNIMFVFSFSVSFKIPKGSVSPLNLHIHRQACFGIALYFDFIAHGYCSATLAYVASCMAL